MLSSCWRIALQVVESQNGKKNIGKGKDDGGRSWPKGQHNACQRGETSDNDGNEDAIMGVATGSIQRGKTSHSTKAALQAGLGKS